MRAFLAAEFQPALEAAVRPAQDVLKGRAGGGFRWVPPGQVHLTLRFLGEIPDGMAPERLRSNLESEGFGADAKGLATTKADFFSSSELGVAITKATAGLPAFPLRTSGYGAFPDASRARILWLGLEDPSAGLPGLLKAIDHALKPFELRWEERPFVAHLTLGRHRAGGSDVAHAFRAAGNPPVSEHRLTGIALFRSVLGPQGAAHSRLTLAPLAAAG